MDLHALARAIDELSLCTPPIMPTSVLSASRVLARDEHRATLLLSIETTKKYYERLSEQTNRLLTLQKELRSRYLALEQGLAPIESLPPELLLIIFEHSVHSSKFSADVARTLSHVNSRWRTITLQTPTLWSIVSFNPPPALVVPRFVEPCLQRAGNQPLSIVLHHDDMSKTLNSNGSNFQTLLYSALVRLISLDEIRPRIRSLQISVPRPNSNPYRWNFPLHLPSLETLAIVGGVPQAYSDDGAEEGEEVVEWLGSLEAPRLSQLEVCGTKWAGFRDTMNAMTSVTITDTFLTNSAVFSIIRHPWLKHLCLRNIETWGYRTWPLEAVPFPNLRTLTLERLDDLLLETLLHFIRPVSLDCISLTLPLTRRPVRLCKDVTQFFFQISSIHHINISGANTDLMARIFLSLSGAEHRSDGVGLQAPPQSLLTLKSLELNMESQLDRPDDPAHMSTALRSFLDCLGEKRESPILDCLTTNTEIVDELGLSYLKERCRKVVRLGEKGEEKPSREG